MSKQYVPVRFPRIAFDNLKKKQKEMERVASKLLGKPVIIPLTKVLILTSKSPMILDDKNLIAIVKKKGVHKI